MQVSLRTLTTLLLCLNAALLTGTVLAAEEAQPQTTSDPTFPVAELELLLKPLTVDELKVEADAWIGLLKEKVEEISAAELAVIYKKEEIEKAEEAQEAAQEAEQGSNTAANGKKTADEERQAQHEAKAAEEMSAPNKAARKAVETAVSEAEPEESAPPAEGENSEVAQKTQIRSKLLDHLTLLREERTALIDRVNTVLAAYKEKGGDPQAIELDRKYVAAVSGIKVDVSDVGSAWTTIYGWLASKEGGIRWAINLSWFVIIVIAFYFLAHLLARALSKTLDASGRAPALLRSFLVGTVRRLTIIIGIIVGLAALEVNIGPLLAVIGAAGFVVAFALQNSLSNFASGILILLYHPFDVGDVIEAGGISGTVASMNLLSTHVNTFDNKMMIVPNNDIWGGVITNATGTNERRVDMTFGIGYDDDIDKAQKILEEIVTDHELVLQEPEPTIRMHELADSSVNFICRPWARTADYWGVYWDITREVKNRFDREGISIPFPQRDVHIYNESPTS